MRRYVFIFLSLLLILTACSMSEEEVVSEGRSQFENLIEALKTGDKGKIQDILGEDSILLDIEEKLLFDSVELNEEEKDKVKSFLKSYLDSSNFSYVDYTNEDGYILSYEVSAPNLKEVIYLSTEGVYEEVLSDEEGIKKGIFNSSKMTDMYLEILNNMLNDEANLEKRNFNVSLDVNGSDVSIIENEELINGIFGNIISEGEKLKEDINLLNESFNERLDKLE